ncbi:hypothetical protein CONPUDRAFT_64281 [Coniophora puteana RWD-64-598 SS2]|uniref:CxC1-like cysteine cluster associated with KDZ transposases domain-containing protein n=1 Tax=Coniophora puteana (strain RWD-64-598) TaxID=741705 RepID=A0A5M3MBC6_CONPW|nr:uncharacterized protein CONPUDRAFT_64281 [Coniophora puteana RWD-64-598 SS2]EIW76532.1 hypothetical protein CONPUDRAFT_64281 [Coniophora puteana RWD-64-598 SS2]
MDFDQVLPAPGDEGFVQSHEGGEFQLYNDLKAMLSESRAKRYDGRDRSSRVADAAAKWDVQYEELADAYLEWQATPLSPTYPSPLDGATSTSPTPSPPAASAEAIPEGTASEPQPEASANPLVRHGLVGCSPSQPTVAISLRTLETYRQTHRVCPRMSIQAQAKMLCHMHGVPYRAYLSYQFRDAYDVYLEVLRRVDQRIAAVLHHDSPHWRMRNSCPACQYHLQDEPPLRFSLLCAMDGNNSLKLVDPRIRSGKERPDPRSGCSDIWLSEAYVDQYKDKVSSSQTPFPPPISSDDFDPDASDLPPIDAGDPTEVCTDRWRNSAPEAKKKMFAVFKKSGIFISVCRHGILLSICDMVRSGEL